MKKNISTLMMIMMVCGLFLLPMEVKAAEVVDGSELTMDEESSVTAYSLTRGVYLLEGTATITKPFTGWAGCFGTTTAHTAVYKIGVSVVLQEYVSGSWVSVDGWTVYEYDDYYISSYKAIQVDGGTYYRVKTSHYAATDSTMIATNGIWIS